MNAFDIVADLKARTDFSDRDAMGIAHAITLALVERFATLATRDQRDARMAEGRLDSEKLRSDFEKLRADVHQALRAQTIWTVGTIIASSGIVIAAVKLF